MAIKLNTNLDANSLAKLVNLPAPTAGGDAVNKTYADALKAGIDWKDSVRAASTGTVTLATPGGTMDGVTLVAGDRVLLKDQTTAGENGIYTWATASSALVRATDADSNAEVTAGLATAVEEGTANADMIWLLTTNNPIVLNTTGLSFSQLGTVTAAGTGLTKTGNTIALTAPVTVALGGTGGTTAAAARAALGVPGKFAQDIGDGVATAFTITHNLGTVDVDVAVFLKSTGAEEEVDVVRTSTNVVTVTFNAAPASATYRVVVIG